MFCIECVHYSTTCGEIHTHTCTNTNYLHTCMYTYSVCVHVYMHTHVHTYINTYMHTYINTFSHAYIAHKELILALPHHTHAHTHTHTHTHTRTHAHISRGGALLYQETRVIWAVVCCCVLAARVDRSVALWVRMRTALALFRCWAFWCQIRLPVFFCWWAHAHFNSRKRSPLSAKLRVRQRWRIT